MKKLFFFILILIQGELLAQTQSPGALPDQYIVVLKELIATPVIRSGLSADRTANKPNKEVRKINIDKIKELQARKKINNAAILFNYADVIVGFSAHLSPSEVTALRGDPSVQGVYQDQKIHLDEADKPGSIMAPAPQIEDCAVLTAGGHTDGSSKFTWIWIIDTGIDTDHPDLNVQSHAPYAISFSGDSFNDVSGHGTHVAGIAAAKDNNVGVVGVSAGAKVVPVRVFDDENNSDYSVVIAALNHVAQYSIPGDVVNMSLGGLEPDCGATSFPALPAAIRNLANAGVWITISAGNAATNATSYFPGCINNTRVFTVAALDCNFNCASFTNVGSNVDWYAVGTNVYSTYLNGGYSTLSGTSMAAPVVAGIIHSRGQAPVKGPDITCELQAQGITTIKPLAKRQ